MLFRGGNIIESHDGWGNGDSPGGALLLCCVEFHEEGGERVSKMELILKSLYCWR